ncbi:MAG: IclR family transcriptional regulator [Oceanospirillales bacterium]|nr:IclR family transcriptional regulator [Oceanospirillales bacterium]
MLPRALHIIELLAETPRGLGLQALADSANMPKSGAHRMLGEMIELGYVEQGADNGQYRLTYRLADIGIQLLANCGLVEAPQPLLDRLAKSCQELVRLAVIDNGRPVFMLKAQGATGALRYDPESGDEAPLYCTATGFAWLAQFDDDEAIRLIAAQGPMEPELHGPDCPRNFSEVLEQIKLTRKRGYGKAINMSSPGMSAITAVVRTPMDGTAVAILSIGGPSARLTEEKMTQYLPLLLSCADKLSALPGLTDYLEPLAHKRHT